MKDLAQKLKSLQGWKIEDGKLIKSFSFANY